ncbi:hypothetical protein, partial [Desulfosporosinus metallidurans]|uniref:hypothetical protein n=1 Tax=Desulfosporosinus metallidurans TaxID=1888891 RepID=UPI001A9A4F5F
MGYTREQGGVGLLCQSWDLMESSCIVPIVPRNFALNMMLENMNRKNTSICRKQAKRLPLSEVVS